MCQYQRDMDKLWDLLTYQLPYGVMRCNARYLRKTHAYEQHRNTVQ